MGKIRFFYVYILSSISGTLYVGLTDHLPRRMLEHKNGTYDGFTKRYGLKRLVYFEQFDDIRDAIQREHKHWPRAWKIRKIVAMNPDWNDLYDEITK